MATDLEQRKELIETLCVVRDSVSSLLVSANRVICDTPAGPGSKTAGDYFRDVESYLALLSEAHEVASSLNTSEATETLQRAHDLVAAMAGSYGVTVDTFIAAPHGYQFQAWRILKKNLDRLLVRNAYQTFSQAEANAALHEVREIVLFWNRVPGDIKADVLVSVDKFPGALHTGHEAFGALSDALSALGVDSTEKLEAALYSRTSESNAGSSQKPRSFVRPPTTPPPPGSRPLPAPTTLS